MRGVAAPGDYGRREAEREPRVQEQALFELTVQLVYAWERDGMGVAAHMRSVAQTVILPVPLLWVLGFYSSIEGGASESRTRWQAPRAAHLIIPSGQVSGPRSLLSHSCPTCPVL